MDSSHHIRYLTRQDVDIAKWDDCIRRSPNGLIYGRSFFLDALTAGRWDALVQGDYSSVMPLPWNRKWSFTYLYQPFFAPMLGVFGETRESSLPSFLRAIPGHFSFWEIDANETNHLSAFTDPPLQKTMRMNYLLPLANTAQNIDDGYKRLARRMVQKAAESNLQVHRGMAPAEVVEHFRQAYSRRRTGIPDNIFHRLTACADTAIGQGHATTYLAKWPDNQVAAFYLVFSDERFVYSVLGGSTDKGKKEGAFYLVTDAAIKDHCNSERSFRFEGSDVTGIAFFNAQFGPTPTPYAHLRLNRLPFPINLLKK